MAEEKKPPGEGEGPKPPGEGEAPGGEGKEEEGWKFKPKGTAGKGFEREAPKNERSWGNEKKEGGEGGEEEKKKTEVKNQVGFGPLFTRKVAEGAVWTNKTGEDDKTFVSVLEGKVEAEALSGAVDLDKKKANLTVVNLKAEGSVVHGQVDLIDKIKNLLFGEKPKPPIAKPPTPAPMAARMGDLTSHGSPLVGGPGSPNVFIGGMPAWRATLDLDVCATDYQTGPVLPGALSVFINGMPAARASDFVMEPMSGPNMIVMGCPTVFIGMAASPPAPPAPPPPEKPDSPWVIFESVAKGDVGKGEASAKAVAEADLAKGKGKIEGQLGAEVALLKGELPFKMRIRIPFTSMYVGLGVTVEGTLISAAAGVNARAAINDGNKLFDASAGAKIGVGLGGVGLKFGLDVSRK